jgi:hypothetical protein
MHRNEGTSPDQSEFYDAIIEAEGTGRFSDPYNETLGYGAYGLPPKLLTEMTIAEIYVFGDEIRAAHGRSSALGAFQIVGRTLRDAQRGLGLNDREDFTPPMQRRIASWIASKQGLGAWAGFRIHPVQRIRAAMAMKRRTDCDQTAPSFREYVRRSVKKPPNTAAWTGRK